MGDAEFPYVTDEDLHPELDEIPDFDKLWE
jgi:hypothetical protein